MPTSTQIKIWELLMQALFWSAYWRISAHFPRISDPPWDQYKSAKILDLYIRGMPPRKGQNSPKSGQNDWFSPANAPSEQSLLMADYQTLFKHTISISGWMVTSVLPRPRNTRRPRTHPITDPVQPRSTMRWPCTGG